MKALYLAICLLTVCGCASSPQTLQIRAQTPGSLPAAVELAETPFYPQTQHHCGPAALATILRAYDVKVSPEILSSEVYIPDRKGSLQVEMAVAARRHDMLPYPLQPKMTDLFAELAAGHPVLVLQNLGLDWYPQWHYAVAIGYDLNDESIILRSGTDKRRLTPFSVFERSWQRADFWALVILPVGNIPATATLSPYLTAAYAFEETGDQKLAGKAYRAACMKWPDSTASWMAYGNIAYQKQNWSEAVNAFHTASRLQPDSTNCWNNLAYALHAHGCRDQAQTAIMCALTLAPNDSNLMDSWHELNNTPSPVTTVKCPSVVCRQQTNQDGSISPVGDSSSSPAL